jgi:hypothetical protein
MFTPLLMNRQAVLEGVDQQYNKRSILRCNTDAAKLLLKRNKPVARMGDPMARSLGCTDGHGGQQMRIDGYNRHSV